MTEQKEKLGAFPYVIGGLSYMPLVGVLFGIVAIVWGLVTKRSGGKKLALIGGGGISVTVILYSVLIYFGFAQRGGVYDDLRANLSETTITSLVQAIEFYKTQNGKYPESLEILKKSLPENSMVFVRDPTGVSISGKQRYYYYEVVDNEHYYLLGVGFDGQPFTQDDVVPKVHVGPHSKVGLLIKENAESGL